MKLSTLEALVAAMRAKATQMGNLDPKVEFYEDDRQALLDAHDTGTGFLNMDISESVIDELKEHVVCIDGDVAKRGDFAIPLKMC